MRSAHRFQRGLTLVEILIAMTLAGIAIAGALRLHTLSSTMFRAAAAQASLRESAQLALFALHQDIENAGQFAFADVRQPSATTTDDAPAIRNDCGDDWSVRIHAGLAGSNNAYAWQCPPYARSAAAGADTLVTRFAAAPPGPALEDGRVHVYSRADGSFRFFVPPAAMPAGEDAPTAIEALRVRGYYVSNASVGASGSRATPSLRVKTLSTGPAGPRIADEEVQPGIDDMQIEFGLDTDAPGEPGYGEIDRFEPPGALLSGERVLAVRLWIRVRSLWHETDLPAQRLDGYADRAAATFSDGYRRALAVTTIAIDASREL